MPIIIAIKKPILNSISNQMLITQFYVAILPRPNLLEFKDMIIDCLNTVFSI